jgi:hypothetical protein
MAEGTETTRVNLDLLHAFVSSASDSLLQLVWEEGTRKKLLNEPCVWKDWFVLGAGEELKRRGFMS